MRKSISRRSFLRLAGISAVTLLAACRPATPATSEPASEAEPQAPAQEEPQAYTGKFVVMSASAVEHIIPLIEEFQEKHPGVDVDWRNLTSERFTELFAAAEVAGDQIDLFAMNGQDFRRYAVADRLMDLSHLDYLDRFRPVSVDTYTFQGKVLALPRGAISPWVLFYNRNALEAIGVTEEISTYDELKEIAPALKDAGYEVMSHEGQVLYMWPVWHFILHAQTSGNTSVERCVATLQGEIKFTDEAYLESFRWLERYAKDEMFISDVLSTDRDGAQRALETGRAAFWHNWPGIIRNYREAQEAGEQQELELDLMPALQVVDGAKREVPGGVGTCCAIYKRIDPVRLDLAFDFLDLMTSDKWVEHAVKIGNEAVASNVNVEASDDPLAIKYGETCAPLSIIYEDWYWPPEITRSFQEGEQAIVAGTMTPEQAAQANQDVLDELFEEGYEFLS